MQADKTPPSTTSFNRVVIHPYYEQDGITIYHGDCREILPTLGKVDLVLTDPPYGIEFQSNRRLVKFDAIAGDSEFPCKWLEQIYNSQCVLD